jgi:hypothetical protein
MPSTETNNENIFVKTFADVQSAILGQVDIINEINDTYKAKKT